MILIPNKKLIELSEIERRIYSIFFSLHHTYSHSTTVHPKNKQTKQNTWKTTQLAYPDSFCVPEDGRVLEVTLTAFGDVSFTFFSEILYWSV